MGAKVVLNLTHPSEGWGSSVFDDGGVAHWIDGRSSVVVFEKDGVLSPIWGGDVREDMNLVVLKVGRSMRFSPMRVMTGEEVLSHGRAMACYYGGDSGCVRVKTVNLISPVLVQGGVRVSRWEV